MIPFTLAEAELLFRELSLRMPLELFSFAGSLFEEIMSPIPGYLVMGIVGSLAFAQGLNLWQLAILTLLGAVGKTLGACLYYFIGDTLEDLFRGSLTKIFRLSPDALENFGKRFTGAHWKDGGFIFFWRLLPVVPTTPFSIGCGMLKINFTVYLIATLLGNFCKDIVYVILGYYGLANLRRISEDIQWYKVEIEWILTFVAIGVFLTFFFQSDVWKSTREKYRNWKKKFDI